MKLFEEGLLLRIFVGERDTYQGRPLHEQIVKKAKELDLAGATVLRGMMGFGAHSRVHTTKLLRLSQDIAGDRDRGHRSIYQPAAAVSG